MTDTMKDVWEFLDGGYLKDIAPKTKDLYLWGLNFDFGNNPFALFLDIIGYTDEHGLGRMTTPVTLGYVEGGYLADALTEWADRPYRVNEWLDALMECHNS